MSGEIQVWKGDQKMKGIPVYGKVYHVTGIESYVPNQSLRVKREEITPITEKKGKKLYAPQSFHEGHIYEIVSKTRGGGWKRRFILINEVHSDKLVVEPLSVEEVAQMFAEDSEEEAPVFADEQLQNIMDTLRVAKEAIRNNVIEMARQGTLTPEVVTYIFANLEATKAEILPFILENDEKARPYLEKIKDELNNGNYKDAMRLAEALAAFLSDSYTVPEEVMKKAIITAAGRIFRRKPLPSKKKTKKEEGGATNEAKDDSTV
jgi:hypothetical protein